jgi:hypothetical protein
LRSGCSSDCDAYIAGGTLSSDFPTTTGQAYGGFNDEYVTELNESGHIVYSRLLGGSFYDAKGVLRLIAAARPT